ncbi:MAG: hypothetical protein ABII01_07630 [Candidatus Woesearchaeota archaeon]
MAMYNEIVRYVEGMLDFEERQQDADLVGTHIILSGLEGVLRLGKPIDRVSPELRLEGLRYNRYPTRCDRLSESLIAGMGEHVLSGNSELTHEREPVYVERNGRIRSEKRFTKDDKRRTLKKIEGDGGAEKEEERVSYQEAWKARPISKDDFKISCVVMPQVRFHFGYDSKIIIQYLQQEKKEHNIQLSELMTFLGQYALNHYETLKRNVETPVADRRNIPDVLKKLRLYIELRGVDVERIAPSDLFPLVREQVIRDEISDQFLMANGYLTDDRVKFLQDFYRNQDPRVAGQMAQLSQLIQSGRSIPPELLQAGSGIIDISAKTSEQSRPAKPLKPVVPSSDDIEEARDPSGYTRSEGGLLIPS